MSSDIDLIEPETPAASMFVKSESILEFWIPDESCHASDITEYSSFSQHLQGMIEKRQTVKDMTPFSDKQMPKLSQDSFTGTLSQ